MRASVCIQARKSGLGSLDDLAGKGGMLGLNAAMVKGLHHQEYSAWIGDKVPSQKALRGETLGDVGRRWEKLGEVGRLWETSLVRQALHVLWSSQPV